VICLLSKIRGVAILLVFFIVAAAVSVPASAITAGVGNTYYEQYANTPGSTGTSIALSPQIIYDSIKQGQTNWCNKTINTYITQLIVDLNWGNPSNSLQLTIYAPDGSIYGPYYDTADGATDGRIHLTLSNSNGVPQGIWYYKVYGYSVSGTQSYSI